MTVPLVPICFACSHYIEANETCNAFPEGIPEAILFEGEDHRRAYPHDNGVRFELNPDKADLLEVYLDQ